MTCERVALHVVMAICLSVGLVCAAAPPTQPPGQNKLPAPQNIECPIVGTTVAVSADAVSGAAAYQVRYIGITSDGTIVSDSQEPTATPADVLALDDFTALIVQMRALPAPKKVTQPPQASGPKSVWSDPCVVQFETTADDGDGDGDRPRRPKPYVVTAVAPQ